MRHLILIAFLLGLGATTAHAQGAAPDVHDGFYVHLHIGPAYTHFTSDELQLDVSGSGGSFDLALGAAVKPNLILYAELFDDIAVGPRIEVAGFGGTANDDTSAGVVAFGVGVAYYLMPVNVYFAGTLAAARVAYEDPDDRGSSELGPGISLKVGKEWKVSRKWGIGIGGQLFFGTMKEKDSDSIEYRATAAALVFSATYN